MSSQAQNSIISAQTGWEESWTADERQVGHDRQDAPSFGSDQSRRPENALGDDIAACRRKVRSPLEVPRGEARFHSGAGSIEAALHVALTSLRSLVYYFPG